MWEKLGMHMCQGLESSFQLSFVYMANTVFVAIHIKCIAYYHFKSFSNWRVPEAPTSFFPLQGYLLGSEYYQENADADDAI